MYKCCRCKSEVVGVPSLENGAGKFCPNCHGEMKRKSLEAMRVKNKNRKNCCVWCGVALTEKNRLTNKTDEYVCVSCEAHRGWLLKAIRLSERPYKYIIKTEAREKEEREARIKMEEKQKANELNLYEVKQQPENGDADARLARLERMLNKLTSALGV